MKFSTLFSAFSCAALLGTAFGACTPKKPSLLIFTKTQSIRHESIPHGIKLVTSIAKKRGWSVDATEDSSIFTKKGLKPYNTLVFISTAGNVLTATEGEALEEFMLSGGAWLGIHAAAGLGADMPTWFQKLVGGGVRSHPCRTESICDDAAREKYPPGGNIRPDTVTIETHDHASTAGLPTVYNRTDEWYSYKMNVADFPETYTVLMTLAENYIDDITLSPELEHMEPVHPVSWYSLYEGKGRVFFTGHGHTNESYSEPYFVKHVTGGLEWVTGTKN